MSVAESYVRKPVAAEASLTVGGDQHELPIRSGTLGPDVIDITALYAETGLFTYDPGFTSTASCESKITFIDGDKGVLLYRGYPIDQLAEHGTFMETCYLLLYGELPTREQYEAFCNRITRHTMVHEQMTRFYTGFRRDAHPMAVMVGVVGALSAFYHDFDRHQGSDAARDGERAHDREDADHRRHGLQIFDRPALRLSDVTSSTIRPTSCTCASRCRARNTRSIQCWRAPCAASSSCTPTMSRTRRPPRCGSRARRAPIPSPASRRASPVCGVPPMAAPTKRRWRCCEEIGSVDRIPEYLKRAKDKSDPFRLMGFGHRVYKNYDPRAKIMQKTCHEVLEAVGHGNDPILKVALELERIALIRRLLHREEALSQYRLLFRHHAEGPRLPHRHVHRAVRHRPHGRLDRAVERDDRGSVAAHRAAAAALYWADRANLCSDRGALSLYRLRLAFLAHKRERSVPRGGSGALPSRERAQ